MVEDTTRLEVTLPNGEQGLLATPAGTREDLQQRLSEGDQTGKPTPTHPPIVEKKKAEDKKDVSG